MTGRIEQENKVRDRIEKKLKGMPDVLTFFYNWMDAREMSYNTMNGYINYVIEFMNFITNGETDNEFYKNITDGDIEKYIVAMRRKNINGVEIKIGDDIRAAKWSALNTFFKFLTQKKYIIDNPMLLTDRPKVKTEHAVTYLTPEEIKSVFDRINTESRKSIKNRDVCIVAMGISTGLRVSAMVNINVENIDFAMNTIKVVEKGNKTRLIPFGETLRNYLLYWLKDREVFFKCENTGPLFVSQQRERISVDSVEYLIKKYTKHLSKKITPHKLRSSAAMNLHGAGTDILTIASLLGHENITTTQRYVRAYEEDKKKATGVLDNLI